MEKDAKLFPFKSRPECYLCYEKVAGVTLHAFREEVRRRKSGGLSLLAKPTSKSKPHRKVVRQEVGMEYIKWYLEQKSKTGQPIKIYYKEDKQYRTFFTFTYDDTYLRVPASAGGYNIMYRLDRIRNVEM
jgi:hypothetical protein